jgi:glycosyltransferase involved in cell wall biosynthesis
LQPTPLPCEIIVVDDGSADNTKRLIQQQYPQVQYLYQNNLGVSAARNLGMQHASREWIAFLDSDDEWLPDKLESQIKALQTKPEYKICYTGENWIRNGRPIQQKKHHQQYSGWIFKASLQQCFIGASTVIIHRDVFTKIGEFDTELPACEDYDLWLRISAEYPILHLDEKLITKYAGHANQLSFRHWGMDRFRIKAIGKLLLQSTLHDLDRNSAIRMLAEKTSIYLTGAKRKRRF